MLAVFREYFIGVVRDKRKIFKNINECRHAGDAEQYIEEGFCIIRQNIAAAPAFHRDQAHPQVQSEVPAVRGVADEGKRTADRFLEKCDQRST